MNQVMIIQTKALDQSLRAKVERLSGENLFACYQCGMCTSGCPFADEMDILPHQVIRLLQLGIESVLYCEAKWVCASCLSCMTHCPKGVDLANIMEALRQLELREQLDPIVPHELPIEHLRRLPPIALVASMRKKSG
jgi:heterodisulfide reductase subunit C